MKNIKIFILALMLFVASLPVQAQFANARNDLYYHTFTMPTSLSLNPALFPSANKWYVSLPRVDANISLPVSYNDLGLQYNESRGVTEVNLNDLLTKLSNDNNFAVSADVDLLGFGFKLFDKLHIDVGTYLRNSVVLGIPMSLTRILTDGNAIHTGSDDPLTLGDRDIVKIQSFAQFSIGAGYKLSIIPLTLGARINILDGIQMLSADNAQIDLTTNEDYSKITASVDYLAHMAGMAKPISSSDRWGNDTYTIGIDKTIPKNFGFTFDIGAKYSLGDFDFSASLVDIGPGIQWKQNTYTLAPKDNNSVSFSGVELSNLISGGTIDTTFAGRLVDSLKSMVNYDVDSMNGYWYKLPARMYLGASYHLGQFAKVGILFHGEWSNGLFDQHSDFRSNTTLSFSGNLFDWFEITFANGFLYDGATQKPSFFNPGFMASLNIFTKAQFYLGLDYISSIYAVDTKGARIFLGINIIG